MPIKENELYDLLESGFPDSEVIIEDLAGDDDHWRATIISSTFEGKSRIQQHKMVQDAVKGHDIHALAIKTKSK